YRTWVLERPEVHLRPLHPGRTREIEGKRLGGIAVAIEVEAVGRKEDGETGVFGGAALQELEVAIVVVFRAPSSIWPWVRVAREEGVGVEDTLAGDPVGASPADDRLAAVEV